MHVFVDVAVLAGAHEADLVVSPFVKYVAFLEALLDADLAVVEAADFVDTGVEVAFVDDEGFEDFEFVVEVVFGWMGSSERHGDDSFLPQI